VLQVLQPPDGGAAEHVFRVVQGISQRGFDVELATGSDSAIAPRLREEGTRVHELPLVRRPGGSDLAAARGLRALDRERRYQLVHAHSAKAGALTRLSLPGRRRLVYTPHCFPFANASLGAGQRLAYRAVEQALVPRSGALVAVCEWERGEGERGLRGAGPLLRTIANGVVPCADAEPDTELLDFKGSEPLAGSIGGLRPPKDPLLAVRAAAALERAGVPGKLAFVGDGEMRDAVTAEIARLGVGERVRWFPYRGEMGSHLAALDLFVLSSESEALPLSVLEAMSCGLPVLATAVGGLPEAVAEGHTGLLAGPGDEGAFAVALERLCSDAALRERLGAAGRERYERRFGLERMLDELAGLYRELLAGGSGVPG
jgi:glycosyltransferase involved in cell wall biosynthesis